MTKFLLTYVFHFSTLETSVWTFLHTLFHHDPSNVYLKAKNTAIQCKTWGSHSSPIGQVVPEVLKDSRASGSNTTWLLDPEYTETMILQNVCNCPPSDTASYPRKLDPSLHFSFNGQEPVESTWCLCQPYAPNIQLVLYSKAVTQAAHTESAQWFSIYCTAMSVHCQVPDRHRISRTVRLAGWGWGINKKEQNTEERKERQTPCNGAQSPKGNKFSYM
jgi:hypothetical protein